MLKGTMEELHQSPLSIPDACVGSACNTGSPFSKPSKSFCNARELFPPGCGPHADDMHLWQDRKKREGGGYSLWKQAEQRRELSNPNCPCQHCSQVGERGVAEMGALGKQNSLSLHAHGLLALLAATQGRVSKVSRVEWMEVLYLPSTSLSLAREGRKWWDPMAVPLVRPRSCRLSFHIIANYHPTATSITT